LLRDTSTLSQAEPGDRTSSIPVARQPVSPPELLLPLGSAPNGIHLSCISQSILQNDIFNVHKDREREREMLLTVASLDDHAGHDAVDDEETHDVTPVVLHEALELLDLLLDGVALVLIAARLHVHIRGLEGQPGSSSSTADSIHTDVSLLLLTPNLSL